MAAFSDRVIVPAHVLIRHLDGESVLLNLETETYFGLDATGTRMWEVATRSATLEAAHESLAHEFDVEPDELRANLTEFITQLVDSGLVELTSANVERFPAIQSTGFQSPETV